MTVKELRLQLQLKVITETEESANKPIIGGYVGDLLSDVMGHLEEGMIWITIQTHRNVVAVATLKEGAALVIPENGLLDEESLTQAKNEGLCVYSTPLSAFEISGKIYNLLLMEK